MDLLFRIFNTFLIILELKLLFHLSDFYIIIQLFLEFILIFEIIIKEEIKIHV